MSDEEHHHQPPLQPGEITDRGQGRLADDQPGTTGFVSRELFYDRTDNLDVRIREVSDNENQTRANVVALQSQMSELKTKTAHHADAIARVFEELRHAGGPNVNLQAAFSNLTGELRQSRDAHTFIASIRASLVNALTIGIMLAMLAALLFGVRALLGLGQ